MIIYKATNIQNNKVYFCITSRKLNDAISIQKSTARKQEKKMKFKNAYKSKSPFHNALNKYGEHSFYYEIIDKNLHKKDAFKLKEKLIKEYKANNPKYGYNCTTGGYYFKNNKETIKKQSESNKGKKLPQYMIDMLKQRVGEKHPCYGYKHTEETKRKMSEAQKNSDYVQTEEIKKRKSETMKAHWKNPTEKMLKDLYNRKHQIGSRDRRGKKNPMYGKGMKGKDNPMYGKKGKLHPLYKVPISKERSQKLQKGREKYQAKIKKQKLEIIKNRTDKKCSRCKNIKDLNEYYKNSQTLDKLSHICKVCDKNRKNLKEIK